MVPLPAGLGVNVELELLGLTYMQGVNFSTTSAFLLDIRQAICGLNKLSFSLPRCLFKSFTPCFHNGFVFDQIMQTMSYQWLLKGLLVPVVFDVRPTSLDVEDGAV
jgi:hypothetical protein